MVMDMKKFAQPFPDTIGELQDLLYPKRTSTQLQDATDTINTVDKVAGRMVFNTTTTLPAFAAGAGATDLWVSADITVGVDLTPS